MRVKLFLEFEKDGKKFIKDVSSAKSAQEDMQYMSMIADETNVKIVRAEHTNGTLIYETVDDNQEFTTKEMNSFLVEVK